MYDDVHGQRNGRGGIGEMIMRKIWCSTGDLIPHNTERKAALLAAGVTIVEFGDDIPANGIQIIDGRPRGFVGCRTQHDPFNTVLMLDGRFSGKCVGQFKDFNRALRRAQKLAASL